MFIDTDTISHVPSDYVVLDIETTGFSACNDSILEIAAIKFHDGKKIDSFCSFVAPECELNEYASRVNGISSEMLKDAPPMEQVLTDFHAFIGLYSLVAHNASFDIPFLQEKMSQFNMNLDNPVIDTLEMARHRLPELDSHRLELLKDHFNIDSTASHRALPDVEATSKIFEHLCSLPVSNSGPQRKRRSYVRNKVNLAEIVPESSNISTKHPLYGKQIVFTGDMTLPRSELAQIAVNCGAIVKSGVSCKTDILVVGTQDISLVGIDGLSTKQEKAVALNSSGKAQILFITESDFFGMTGIKEELIHGTT